MAECLMLTASVAIHRPTFRPCSTIDHVVLREIDLISKFKVLSKLIESLFYKMPYSHYKIKRVQTRQKKIHMVILLLMTHLHVPMFVHGKIQKENEYQTTLRNVQTCIAFEKNVMCHS